MSKLTDRSKKDIFYPSTGLENDRNNKPVKTLTGENTSKIKKDKKNYIWKCAWVVTNALISLVSLL